MYIYKTNNAHYFGKYYRKSILRKLSEGIQSPQQPECSKATFIIKIQLKA